MAAPIRADVVRSINLGTPSYIGTPSIINGTLEIFFGSIDYRNFFPDISGNSKIFTTVKENTNIAVDSASGLGFTFSGSRPFDIPNIQNNFGISYSNIHLKFPEGIKPFTDFANYSLTAIEVYGETSKKFPVLTNNRFDVSTELGVGVAFGVGYGKYESALVLVDNITTFQVPYSFVKIVMERGNLGIITRVRIYSTQSPEIVSQLEYKF